MRTRRLAVLGSVGLALTLAGCVSLKRTPEARFFVLRSVAEPPAAAGAPGTTVLLGLLPVVLPGYLDRPQIASWVAPGELRIDEYLRWAEPLDVGLNRTLAANLEALMPQSRVLRAPWPSSARLRCRVRVELQKLGPQPSGEVLLQGRFALLPADDERRLAARPVSLERRPLVPAGASLDAAAGVDAMSELVADLAREIAAAISALPAESDDVPPPGDAAAHR
ncbi:MAG TPA: PqiC family protein [Vicinamibacteria bacterium]|nr:PqiC family protein [Vicinamibacteria bacterium]